MKKFVSILLALAMILAMSTTAFATTLTINDSGDRTYNGYKLLNLTTSLNCDHAEGATHEDGCYNYAYTVNENYKAILQALAGEVDILTYLSGLEGDTKNGNDITFDTLHDAAEDIYAAILAADIKADAPEITNTAEIAQGYWLFVDVTELDGKNDANSFVIVDTKGQEELTLTPKTALPTLEKKVMDVNDSTGEATDWQDSADYDIGDTVPFQLTVTMPSNLEYYSSYEMVIHDTLSAGLTLNVDSIDVTIDGKETDAFTYDATTGEFTLTCENVLAIEGVDKDSVIVVTYDAVLNTDAVIGAVGNPNTAYLEFSNNPYGDGTGQTTPDKVIVFTYQLTINKVDENEDALEGAGFILYKKDSVTGEYKEIAVGTDADNKPIYELKGDQMTTFVWTGLDDGNYKLEEKTVPDGYNKMNDIEFTITATHDIESDNPALITLTSTLCDTDVDEDGNTVGIIEDIENQTGTVLPETGAMGTMMLITGSTVLIMVAAVFMITRKKMSIYED